MTILITGANRGIGYQAARLLAYEASQHLVLAGRDSKRLSQAAEQIRTETGNPNLTFMHLDLASLRSVREFAYALRAKKFPAFRTIICNAGISKPTIHERSEDGYELTFAINHLGHFLLVHLLLDLLQPPARILFVSSAAHDPSRMGGPIQAARYINAVSLAYPEQDPSLIVAKDPGGQAYATSKLCNVLCTYELARRLESSGLSIPTHPITVNAYDPGLIAGTDLGREGRTLLRLTWYYLLPMTSRLFGFGRRVEEAGADLAYLATAPDLNGVTGKYFSGRKMTNTSVDSYDEGKAEDLWATSIELCKLQPNESLFVASAQIA